MPKFKFLSPLAVTLGLVILLASCSKEPEKGKEDKVPFNNQVQQREESKPLFRLDHAVPKELARALAQKVNLAVSPEMRVGASNSIRMVDSLHTISDSLGRHLLYIANYSSGGYIIIAADDRHEPICALVKQGKYEVAEVPSMLIEWLAITAENIMLLRDGFADSSNLAIEQWIRIVGEIGEQQYTAVGDCCPKCPNHPECLTNPEIGCGEDDLNCGPSGSGGNEPGPCGPVVTTTKGPLMSTRWGQGCSYNEACPNLGCNACIFNKNALTGCVATALAQVIKYWGLPCTQNYNYPGMPISSGDTAVQRLMFDAGTAVDMDWGCTASSATGTECDNALTEDFCFGSASHDGYSPGSYITVGQDIALNRSVILMGCSKRSKFWNFLWYTYSECHAWVCDGYQRQSNNCGIFTKFHMNWGWRGLHNGWFFHNKWAPNTNTNYQYAQDFTHNIHP